MFLSIGKNSCFEESVLNGWEYSNMKNIATKWSGYFSVGSEQDKLSFTKLAWPMMLENIMKYLITTVNTLIVSSYSDDAVAAVGVAGQIINLINVSYSAIGVGIMVAVSQNIGAGNKKKVQNIASISIGMTMLISLGFMAIVFLLYQPILRVMQLESGLMKDGSAYLVIVSAFTVFEGLISTVSALAKCYGYTKIPMIVMTIMNALNAVGSYIVIKYPYGMVFSGVTGVAVARGISVILSFLVLLCVVRKVPMGLTLKAYKKENEPLKNMKMILKIGVPSGISSISYQFSQTVATAILAEVGVAAVATMVYVNNIVQYIKAFSLAISHAYQIMIGRLIGMKNKEEALRFGKMSIGLCAVTNAVFTILIVIFRYPLLRLFTDAPEILQMAGSVMVIDIIVEIFRAMNHGGGGCLTAAGDTKYFMAIGIFSCWFFSILFSWLFGVVLHMGIYGCWLAFCLDEGFRATSYFRRWLSKKWEKYAVVE